MKIIPRSFRLVGSVCVALILAAQSNATAVQEQVMLLPTTLGDGIDFGVDTAIDGNYAAAVAWGFNSVPSAFYVYDRRTGNALSTVTLPETSNTSRFSAIDISGNRLLVGSPGNPIGNNPVAGNALVFDISNPYQPQQLLQLTAPTVNDTANYGAQIEFRGNKALIGAYGGGSISAPGAAYIYDLSDLSHIHVTTLHENAASSPYDYFGITLSMNDKTAIVGSFAGKVFLFDLGIGEQLAELKSPGPQYSRFGESVDISGDRAIIWSQWDTGSGQHYGAAHIYDVSNPTSPTYLSTLTGSTPLVETSFQGRVAIEGDWAILSARSANAAYAFNIRDLQDVREIRLKPSQISSGAEFGISIDIDKTNVIVGAWGERVSGIRSGSAYVFTVPEPNSALILSVVFASTFCRLRLNKHGIRITANNSGACRIYTKTECIAMRKSAAC